MLLCVRRNALLHLFCQKNETTDLVSELALILLDWFRFLRCSTSKHFCCSKHCCAVYSWGLAPSRIAPKRLFGS